MNTHLTKNKFISALAAGLLCGSLLFCAACSSGTSVSTANESAVSNDNGTTSDSYPNRRQTVTNVLLPSAPGNDVYASGDIVLDHSNISDGYFMFQYSGASDSVRLQVTDPSENIYQYNVLPGEMTAFPLSSGDGHYNIVILEHAFDNLYAAIGMEEFDVVIDDEFSPFLYPNEYAWYTADSAAAVLAAELSSESTGDIDFVEKVYEYVISNISYDYELAAHVPDIYIPNADSTLETSTGICFDYASVMTTMLRSQGIPTKLVVGYADQVYHAWISVYLDEIGWVDNIIEFNGTSWSLMDPTYAANNDNNAVGAYIGAGTHYTEKYTY